MIARTWVAILGWSHAVDAQSVTAPLAGFDSDAGSFHPVDCISRIFVDMEPIDGNAGLDQVRLDLILDLRPSRSFQNWKPSPEQWERRSQCQFKH